MHRVKILFFLFMSLSGFGYTFPIEYVTKDQMIQNLEVLRVTLETCYAPFQWKKDCYQWSLEDQIENAKTEIKKREYVSLKDYHFIMKSIISSTKDYHMHIKFHSTEQSFLPFTVKGVGSKYFITSIDRFYLPQENFPFKEGDELVHFDGVPVEYVIKDIMLNERQSNPATDQSLAEIYLTKRLASMAQRVPKNQVQIGVRSDGKKDPVIYQMNWQYTPEKIQYASFFDIYQKNYPLCIFDPQFMIRRNSSIFALELCNSQNIRVEDALSDSNRIGAKQSFVPTLGKVIWKPLKSSPWNAYIYINDEGKNIGYIRIPTYSLATFNIEEFNHHAEEFGKIINHFEKHTEVLVIDQVNNPGGNILYMYALLSYLASYPLDVIPEHIMLTQKDIEIAIEELEFLNKVTDDEELFAMTGGKKLFGYPVNMEFIHCLLNFSNSLITSWKQGKRLTDLDYPLGIKVIQQNSEGCYNKPILVLINELDFSCGDFFPAILRDNDRATLFGSRTAGAGGSVEFHEYKNCFGVSTYSITNGFAKRKNGAPIENLGISPDIYYNLSENDIKNGYQDYAHAVNLAVIELLEKENKKLRR
ncbi:MAG: protease-like activity factor CPAF [Chlamydiales bacterium]